MTATCDEIPSLNKRLTDSVTELMETEPLDPTYYNRDDDFSLKETPDYRKHTEITWGEWYSYWQLISPSTNYDEACFIKHAK